MAAETVRRNAFQITDTLGSATGDKMSPLCMVKSACADSRFVSSEFSSLESLKRDFTLLGGDILSPVADPRVSVI